MRALIDFLDLLKPGWQLIQILVMSGLVVYAVYSLVRRFDALVALFVGCLLSNMAIVTVVSLRITNQMGTRAFADFFSAGALLGDSTRLSFRDSSLVGVRLLFDSPKPGWDNRGA